VDAYTADYASRNPAAYEAYIAGLQAFVDYKYPEAEKAFRQALNAAPTIQWPDTAVPCACGNGGAGRGNARHSPGDRGEFPASGSGTEVHPRCRGVLFPPLCGCRQSYRDLIAAYPYELEARHLLALTLMENRQPKEAIEPLKFMAKMEPETHSTWSALGMAYLESRNLNEAVTAFRRYVELEPSSANAHHTLADAYRAQGEFDLASEEYGKAIAADSSFYFSQVSLGVLDVLRSRYEDAEKRLDSVVMNMRAEARQRIDAAFELASLQRAQGRFGDSIKPLELLQKEIEKERIREAWSLSIRGLSAMEIGDIAECRSFD